MKQIDPMGRLLLKTTGVLMIVFGAAGILLYALLLGVLAGVAYVTDGIFSVAKDIVGMSLLLAASLAELIAGVKGVKALKRPERAAGCRLWGVLTLVLGLAALIHILLRSGDPVYWLGLPLTVVTPVAYLIGARMAASPADRPEETEAETEEETEAAKG